jgi:RHS repeat-associated protein
VFLCCFTSAVTVLDANFGTRSATAIGNSIVYTGRQIGWETGLFYYRNRHYHAQLGGFVSRDPIGYGEKDNNLYRYTKLNPASRVDPDGLAGSVTVYMIACNKIPPLSKNKSSKSFFGERGGETSGRSWK